MTIGKNMVTQLIHFPLFLQKKEITKLIFEVCGKIWRPRKKPITLKYQPHYVLCCQDNVLTQNMYTVELVGKFQAHFQFQWETERKQCEGMWESWFKKRKSFSQGS